MKSQIAFCSAEECGSTSIEILDDGRAECLNCAVIGVPLFGTFDTPTRDEARKLAKVFGTTVMFDEGAGTFEEPIQANEDLGEAD